MFIEGLLFLIGLVLLVKGSDFFVHNASNIALRYGVSDFVIGLTIVAVGTSVPELASSIAAALRGSSDLVMGNVVGSNIANIALVIGVMALLARVTTNKQMLVRDGYIMLFSTLVLYVFMLSGTVNLFASIVLLMLYACYLLYLLDEEISSVKKEYNFTDFIAYVWNARYIRTVNTKKTTPQSAALSGLVIKDLSLLILSLIAIIFGARFVVDSALYFAGLWAVPEAVVGVTIIALGTSLPELGVSVSAARKGLGHMAIGNIIGSNMANILLIVSVSGIISPLVISKNMAFVTMPFLILLSALLLVFIRSHWRVRRREAAVFLSLYAIFMLAILFVPELVV